MLIPVKDISDIPEGHYCYKPLGWDGDRYKTLPCKYYTFTEYGTTKCTLLGVESLDPTPYGRESRALAYKHFGSEEKAWAACTDDLLWDAIKACSYNCEEEDCG